MSTSLEPSEHRARVNGVELAYFEWGRHAKGALPTIFFVHATGFHARVFDRVIAHLFEPGERHVLSVDQRGHGRSGEKVPILHWRDLSDDLAALVGELGLEGAVGVGHSMGGHALVDAAAARPGAFARLLLIDPVIASPGDYPGGGWKAEQLPGGVHPTARRKNHFASPQAMFERFADRSPYALFEPEALRDYCEHGLLPAPDGEGYVLACPPEVEASVYMTSRTNPAIYDSVRALDIPVLILRAREHSGDGGAMDFTSSPTWPGLVGEFRRGREVHLADRTHFLPMEVPALVAGYVLDEPAAGSEAVPAGRLPPAS